MVTYAAPGSYVEEHLLSLSTPPAPPDGTALHAFVGALNRGPVEPTLCRSWSDFRSAFGGFDGDAALPFAVYSYFQNGGRSALVVRVPGSSAVVATRALTDVGGHPAVTLKAANPGAWGNNITVDVVSSAQPGRVNLYVYLAGAQIERYIDLSMDPLDRRFLISVLNAQSTVLQASTLSSDSVGDQRELTAQAATALASGANGTAPTAASLVSAQDKLERIESPLVCNLPGVTDVGLLSDYLGWAEQRGNVFMVIAVPLGRDIDAALAFGEGLFPATDPSGADGFAQTLIPTSYGALYYPGLVIADPASVVPGATRLIDAGGAMLGQYATTDATAGVFKAPAGLSNVIVGAVGLERQLSDDERGRLNSGVVPVNALRVIPGGGIVPYGARTMKAGAADKYIPVRRTLIYVRQSLIDLTRFAAFQPNDPDLWEQLRVRCTGFLQDFYQQGGLRGAVPEQAYFVRCDSSINGQAQIENGETRVEVGVSLQYPNEFTVISLSQFEGGSAITDAAAL